MANQRIGIINISISHPRPETEIFIQQNILLCGITIVTISQWLHHSYKFYIHWPLSEYTNLIAFMASYILFIYFI